MTDALKLALEALEQVNAPKQWPFAVKQDTRRAIEALRAALAAPQPAAPAQVEVFSEHDKGILRDLEAMAADKSSGFWPQILAVGSLRIIKRLAAPQWQPIETAPKEAQLLLTAELDCRGDWRIKTGYYDTGVEAWFVWGASWKPTHWRPLPAAPGITAPQGEQQ